jgi:hypothetical protein
MAPERTDAGSSEDPNDSEAAQGGADAIEGVEAPVPAENGVNWIAWVAVLAAVLFAVIYGLGIFH